MKNKIVKLCKSYEFRKVYKEGKSVSTARTVLLFKKNNKPFNRIGISVNKKVGKSVVRHRIKRLYLEAYRSLRTGLKEGYDLVIVARKDANTLTYKEAARELDKLMLRGKLWE